jgi:hypothetical protein
MRDRHFPRLCRSCQVPMARQEDTCWRCGAQWADEDAPRTTLQVIAGGAPSHVAITADPSLDADRWMNEGGSLAPEAAPLRATAGRT